MSRKELIALKRKLFADMVGVLNLCAREEQCIGKWLEPLAALRHLYEVASKELADAEDQVGRNDTMDQLLDELANMTKGHSTPLAIKEVAARCQARLKLMFPQGGAS